MKIILRKTIALAVCIAMILSINVTALAIDDTVSISFKVGSDTMSINGNSVKAERSYRVGNYTLVPLRSILEAFGAEVNWKGNGKITLIYRDTTIDMTIGEKKCIVNGEEKELPAAPAMSNGSTMVPTRFITENFGADVDYDSKTETIGITLADDGAITDFSIITGGISKAKIGNSYFGWSINIPKGSQLMNNSETSSNITVRNTQKEMSLELSVNTEYKKTINDYLDDINKNPKNYGITKLIGSSINKNASPNYAEFIYSTYFGESVKRIYIANGYVYDLVLTLDTNIKEATIQTDTFTRSILDSFSLGYKGSNSEIQDFSKVKDGFVKYENDIFGYSIDILPDWSIISNSSNILPMLGNSGVIAGNTQGLDVKIDKIEAKDTIENYMNKIKEANSQNYNSKYYNFIELKSAEGADKKTNKLIYSLTFGSTKYIIEENIVRDGDLIYDIIIKSLDSKYSSVKEKYPQILNSFKFSTEKHDEIFKGLGELDDIFGSFMTRVGKDDSPTLCESKTAKWQMYIPGNWLNLTSSFDEESQFYMNPKSGAIIALRTLKNDDKNRNQTDEIKFELDSIGDNYKLINKENSNEKGKQVRIYNYSVEDPQDEISAAVKVYVLDGSEYSYCLVTMLTDIFASDKNIKEIKDVWTSFNPMG